MRDLLPWRKFYPRYAVISSKKHEYASRAEVVGKTTYYLEGDFNSSEVYQAADVTMKIMIERDGNDERRIAVAIPGMSVCPSAQRSFHEFEETPLNKSPSHTQRANITVEARTKESALGGVHA